MELKTNYVISCDVMNLMFCEWEDSLHFEDEKCQTIEISGVKDMHIVQLTRNAFCAGDTILSRFDELPDHYKESLKEAYNALHKHFNKE